MKRTNEWISNAAVNWEDPTICSEIAKIEELSNDLRTFCIETCLILPEVLRDPFLEFLDFVEKEEWCYRDVIVFRDVLLDILNILEPIHEQVNPKELDMMSWYMLGAFAESWKSKVEDVALLWESENRFLMN